MTDIVVNTFLGSLPGIPHWIVGEGSNLTGSYKPGRGIFMMNLKRLQRSHKRVFDCPSSNTHSRGIHYDQNNT